MKVIEYAHGKIEDAIILLLGYFDGMHLGHQKLLQKARAVAKQKNYKIAIMTFLGNKEKKVIYTYPERLYTFEKLGIDYCIVANFDRQFKRQTGREFIEHLTQICNLKAVVCGSDFTFGNGALEHVDHLKTICNARNIQTFIEEMYSGFENVDNSFATFTMPVQSASLDTCEIVDTFRKQDKISTTTIKKWIECGALERIEKLLGYPYFILGKVIAGNQLGRTIGFPTANIQLDRQKVLLKTGVYAVQVAYGGKIYKGIANLGQKPTVNGVEHMLEVHILGFSQEIYGQNIVVYFLQFIREIQKFKSLEELKNQIQKDIKKI